MKSREGHTEKHLTCKAGQNSFLSEVPQNDWNVLTNSTTKHSAVATIFHPAKMKHLQHVQELSNACALFDILKLNICINYCKIKTRCANGGNQERESFTLLPGLGGHCQFSCIAIYVSSYTFLFPDADPFLKKMKNHNGFSKWRFAPVSPPTSKRK